MDRNVPFDVIRPAIDVVALRKESVDRNYIIKITVCRPAVALRKESVDRNSSAAKADSVSKVALRKESVDRNFPGTNTILFTTGRSPQGERG